MHRCSDSGTDRNYHAQDTAGSARNDIMIEVLKNAMFGPAQFSVYAFACSIEEMPFHGV